MDDVDPAPRTRSVFTLASWLALAGGLLITVGLYFVAVAMRRPGDWFPGVGEALIGILLTGVGSFGCGLAALLRRELRRWWALPPFLAGLATMLYFAWGSFMR